VYISDASARENGGGAANIDPVHAEVIAWVAIINYSATILQQRVT